MDVLHSQNDKRNASAKAFEEDKYKTFVSDASQFDAIAKGTWSSAKEDPSWRGGFRRYGASKLFLIMMILELQQRLEQYPALEKVRALGVDPGTMISGLQRLSPWPIRVLMFQIIFPLVLTISPKNGTVRRPQSSASDILQAAFGSEAEPGPSYFNGTEPLETSAESRDSQKRTLVWSESAKCVNLKGSETVLQNWQ